MSHTTFKLFEKIAWSNYAQERVQKIHQQITNMSDDEILKHENDLDKLANGIQADYSVKPLEISYDKEKGHLHLNPYLKRHVIKGRRGNAPVEQVFVRYAVYVNGNMDLLEVWPYGSTSGLIPIPASMGKNQLMYEIPVEYYNTLDVSDEAAAKSNKLALQIKKYIEDNIASLNKQAGIFNVSIFENAKPKLVARLELAQRNKKGKSKLDPF